MSVAIRPFNKRVFILSGLVTAFFLIGGMLLGGVLGAILNERLPGHSTDAVNVILSAIPAFGGVFAGGAVWGWVLSGIARVSEQKRMTIAGALGFGPVAIVTAIMLTVLESIIVEQNRGPALPIHNIFTILFAPAAALVSGIGGLAIGIGARVKQPRRLALMSALGGGITFLVVNLLLDALGGELARRVRQSVRRCSRPRLPAVSLLQWSAVDWSAKIFSKRGRGAIRN